MFVDECMNIGEEAEVRGDQGPAQGQPASRYRTGPSCVAVLFFIPSLSVQWASPMGFFGLEAPAEGAG